jgi:hypothetical protein
VILLLARTVMFKIADRRVAPPAAERRGPSSDGLDPIT